ncbi:MAG: hypothetical protein HQ547_05140, partial [Candidatus Omnitrophica bacterium]|nr:hypothetical protein [Candidatus Omnitrophota bacterium]
FIISKALSARTYVNILRKIRSIEDLSYTAKLMCIPLSMLLRIVRGKQLSNMAIRSKKENELKPIEKTLEDER